MAIYWHWEQIVFCGIIFLVGFAIGHLTGMHEGLHIIGKSLDEAEESD